MPVRFGNEPVAFGPVSAQTWFSSNEIVAEPGTEISLPLSIHNLGDSTESYTVIPAGLAASWTQVTRGNITLFGGSRDVIDILITPPAIPTTSAGPTSVATRGSFQ